MRIIKVGSRDSDLAVAQARLVIEAIRRTSPDIEPELVTMKTTGDKLLDRPLDSLGGKGLFIKELDEALRDGRVDICVHSYKDMPAPDDPELPVAAVSGREDPRDVLVLPEGCDRIPDGRPIGTSSPRRRLQLSRLFPGLPCEPVRGNIATRLRKLDSGQYGALVLAAAGLKRLGLWRRVHRVFEVEEMLPAACQGMLAIQARARADHSFLKAINDADAFDAATAERSFIEALDATCASPVAAYAEVDGEALHLSGLRVDATGAIREGKKSGTRAGAKALGRALALELRDGT